MVRRSGVVVGVMLPLAFIGSGAAHRRKEMADEEQSEQDLWDQMVMDGVNADTEMTPDAIFVREYVRHGDEMLAVNRAGLSDSRYSLSVIAEYHLGRPEIKAAIAIQRQLVKENADMKRRVLGGYSRELILEDLENLHQLAKEAEAYAPAITAKKTQAQLLGFLDQTVNINHSVVPREMTTDELRLRIAELSRGALEAPAVEVERPAIIEAEYVEVKEGGGDAV